MHCFMLAAIFGLLPCVAVTLLQKTPSLDDLEDGCLVTRELITQYEHVGTCQQRRSSWTFVQVPIFHTSKFTNAKNLTKDTC